MENPDPIERSSGSSPWELVKKFPNLNISSKINFTRPDIAFSDDWNSAS